jgi:DNA repair exonuclease SbcCD nuclease subunit
MLKVIVIGDQHFKIDNVEEIDIFIEKITILITENKPDFIVLLGDLLDTHERIHAVPLNRAYKFIDNMRKISKTYILVGNHDMSDNQQFMSENHWLNALKEWNNVVIVDKIFYEIIDDMKFIFCPYVYVGRFEEALNLLDTDWKDTKCIFAHQEFYGCKMGAFNSIDGDKWELNYPQVISGHIHLNQKPQDNIYYPGSSLSVAFGESATNIVSEITFSEDIIINEIDLNMPKKKIIYIDSEKADDIIIPDSDDKIKLSISGEYEDFKSFKKTQKYKELTKKGVKVVFKAKKTEIKDKKQNIKESLENNLEEFNDIIRNIIEQQKNSYLFEAYELVINSKNIDSNDVLFL